MTTKKAEKFLKHKYKLLRKEGYPIKQSWAIAYAITRKKRFKYD